MTTIDIDRWIEESLKVASSIMAQTENMLPPMAIFLCYGDTPTTPPQILCGSVRIPILLSPVVDSRRVMAEVTTTLKRQHVFALLRFQQSRMKVIVTFESMGRAWSRTYRVDESGLGDIIRQDDELSAVVRGHWLFDKSCIN